MAYPIYYPSGCDAEIPDHLCSNCDDIEHGRIRSVAFIRKDFHFMDESNPNEWRQGILNKQIIIIPEVNGTFDGGSEQTGDGYGDQQTKLLGYNFSSTFKDPNYKQNAKFWNAILASRNYRYAYRTESQIHITDEVVQVIPKNPVTAATTDEVTWEVTVNWSSGKLPEPVDAPEGTFTCFDYL